MAKSEIELINRALVKIGTNPIQGLEENRGCTQNSDSYLRVC